MAKMAKTKKRDRRGIFKNPGAPGFKIMVCQSLATLIGIRRLDDSGQAFGRVRLMVSPGKTTAKAKELRASYAKHKGKPLPATITGPDGVARGPAFVFETPGLRDKPRRFHFVAVGNNIKLLPVE